MPGLRPPVLAGAVADHRLKLLRGQPVAVATGELPHSSTIVAPAAMRWLPPFLHAGEVGAWTRRSGARTQTVRVAERHPGESSQQRLQLGGGVGERRRIRGKAALDHDLADAHIARQGRGAGPAHADEPAIVVANETAGTRRRRCRARPCACRAREGRPSAASARTGPTRTTARRHRPRRLRACSWPRARPGHRHSPSIPAAAAPPPGRAEKRRRRLRRGRPGCGTARCRSARR
jgi:hypothetical protein